MKEAVIAQVRGLILYAVCLADLLTVGMVASSGAGPVVPFGVS